MPLMPLRFAITSICALVVSVMVPVSSSVAATRIQLPPLPADPPTRPQIVEGTWSCNFDAALGTLTMVASDPGTGKAVDAHVDWTSYHPADQSPEKELPLSTNEACLGPLVPGQLGSQVPANEVRTVVFDVPVASVVSVPVPDRLRDGHMRKYVVNAGNKAVPRLVLSYGRGDVIKLPFVPLIAHRDGFDLDADGALDITINAPQWLIDIDAPYMSGSVDLREIPTPPLSNIRADISLYKPGSTNTAGTAGPVRFTGPKTSANVFLRTGSSADRITLYAGHDYVMSGGGSDTINTGGGDDVVWAGSGSHDIVYAGSGNDIVNGGPGRDTVYLGAGDDQGFGSGGSYDRIFGQSGDDFASVGGPHGLLSFGPGNDYAFSYNADTRVICGTGYDDGPSRDVLGRTRGCEHTKFRAPPRPSPYIAPLEAGLRAFWCGGRRTDKNYCRTLNIYD